MQFTCNAVSTYLNHIYKVISIFHTLGRGGGMRICLYLIFRHQAQASEQFLSSIKLASNKAICLKIKNINKSNMYF
jgi:hypothetical protein